MTKPKESPIGSMVSGSIPRSMYRTRPSQEWQLRNNIIGNTMSINYIVPLIIALALGAGFSNAAQGGMNDRYPSLVEGRLPTPDEVRKAWSAANCSSSFAGFEKHRPRGEMVGGSKAST